MIHPDLLADIVITNMRHLPKMPPPLSRPGLPVGRQIGSLSSSAQVVSGSPTSTVQSPVLTAQMSFPSVIVNSSSVADTSNVNNFPVDSKRDPRRVIFMNLSCVVFVSTITVQKLTMR